MTSAQRDHAIAALAEQLGEFADAVQVLACYQDEDGNTACVKRGNGNWYARVGMAREFLTEDQARVAEYTVETDRNCDDDD